MVFVAGVRSGVRVVEFGPNMTRYLNFCSACAVSVTVVIFGHVNRSFYLLSWWADRMTPLPVGPNLRWRPPAILFKNSNWHNYGSTT